MTGPLQVYTICQVRCGAKTHLESEHQHIYTTDKTMSAVVRKLSPVVVVRPSRLVRLSDTGIKVSSFDKHLEKLLAVISLLVFENPFHEPANTIIS